MVLAFVRGMLFLYTMRTLETLAPVRFALVLICAITLSVSGQAQDAVMNAPEVMPVLNSCALIEDRTERESCSNQGIMEHIIGKLEYPPAPKTRALRHGRRQIHHQQDRPSGQNLGAQGSEELSRLRNGWSARCPGSPLACTGNP